ncbi:DUF7344 domain-containing protein [Natronorubrum tibetense]|uniref:DUF7344 domain-containing protein n=1 Tax=Natronorubrum tibetense TaxID=63128 RepID=UPI00037A863D|nr:hypothetical protein [Natronorubrum tibetense]
MVNLGTVFDLLEDKRRRYALYYLDQRDGPVAISELVERIDEWEDEPTPTDPSADAFEDIAIELTHTHLPRAAEVDFVQYDREQGTVQIQGAPPKFDTFMNIARLIEEPEE